jgi:initiation factor 1A
MPAHKKGANNTRDGNRHRQKKSNTIIYGDEKALGQLYGTVDSVLGSCHFEVSTINNGIKRCALTGSVKAGSRVKVGDYVLIEPMDTNDKNYLIIFKYSPEQKKILEREGKVNAPINNTIVKNNEDKENEIDDGFTFENPEASIHEKTKEDMERAELALINDLVEKL